MTVVSPGEIVDLSDRIILFRRYIARARARARIAVSYRAILQSFRRRRAG